MTFLRELDQSFNKLTFIEMDFLEFILPSLCDFPKSPQWTALDALHRKIWQLRYLVHQCIRIMDSVLFCSVACLLLDTTITLIG